MPQTLFAPVEFANAFRSAFPQYRPDLKDPTDLYRHVKETYPDQVGRFVDPLLEGSETLGVFPTPSLGKARTPFSPLPLTEGQVRDRFGAGDLKLPQPVPPPVLPAPPTPSKLLRGTATAIRVAPPLAIAGAGMVGAIPSGGTSVPASMALSGGVNMASEYAAQQFEVATGQRDELDPRLMGTAAIFGAVPGAPIGKGVGAVTRAGVRAAEGAGLGLAQQEVESRMLGTTPTWQERALVGGVGSVLGGGFGGVEARGVRIALENMEAAAQTRRLNRQTLAANIRRIAHELEATGVPLRESRRYAKQAAEAMFNGTAVPRPPIAKTAEVIPSVESSRVADTIGASEEAAVRWQNEVLPTIPPPPKVTERGLPTGEIPSSEALDEIVAANEAMPSRVFEPKVEDVGERLRESMLATPTTPPRLIEPAPSYGAYPNYPRQTPAIEPLIEQAARVLESSLAQPTDVGPPRLYKQGGYSVGRTPRPSDSSRSATGRPGGTGAAPLVGRDAFVGVGERGATVIPPPPGAPPLVAVAPPPPTKPVKPPKALVVPRPIAPPTPPPRPTPIVPRPEPIPEFVKAGARVMQRSQAGESFPVVSDKVRRDIAREAERAAMAARYPELADVLTMPPGSEQPDWQAIPEGHPALSQPPGAPEAPAAPPLPKDVVVTNEAGQPIGTARVSSDYPRSTIPERVLPQWSSEKGAITLGKSKPLYFHVPPGDVPALKAFIQKRGDLRREPFFRRAQSALDRGNPSRAWQILQAEQYRQQPAAARKKALGFAEIRGERGSVREQEAGVRTTTRIPEPRPVSRRQFGQLTLRASGLKDVGSMPEPTTILHLPPAVQDRIIKAIDRATMGRVKGNIETDYRTFRQVAHQILDNDPSLRAISRSIGLTPEELASGWSTQVTEAARLMQKLQRLTQEIPNLMEDIKGKTGLEPPPGFGEALAKVGGDTDETLINLYGGVFGFSPDEALAWAAKSAAAMDELYAQKLLEKSTNRGPLARFNDLRRAGLTGTIAAAWRNLHVGAIRWNAGVITDFMAGVASMDPVQRRELLGRAKDRLTAYPHAMNMVTRPLGSTIFEMWPRVADAVLQGRDPRKTLRAISQFSDQESHFLGLLARDLPQSIKGQDQYVKLIQTANRAQEYPLRAMAADLRMRQLIVRRGFDPNTVLNDPDNTDLIKIFGSPEAAERAVQDAVSYGLDYTFAGDAIPGSLSKTLIDAVNNVPQLSAIQSFPRFAWSANPRYIWDHSPGIMVEMALSVLSAGKLPGARFQRWQRGRQSLIASTMLGNRETRLHELGLQRGQVAQQLMALRKERMVLNRRLTSLEGRQETGTLKSGEAQKIDLLRRQMQEIHGAIGGQETNLRRLQHEESILKTQRRKLAKSYGESVAAAASEYPQEVIAKATLGMMLWGSMHALRSREDQQDLPWYKVRTPVGVVDSRAFAPFTVALFMGEVTSDMYKHTNWGEYTAGYKKYQAEGDDFMVAGIKAFRDAYHGKYTSGVAIQDGLQLALSMSPAGGVSAMIYDLVAPEGITTDQLFSRLTQIAGEWLAGPLQPATDVSNLLSPIFPGEATIRDASMLAPETPFAELSQPLTKIPGVKQLFPEQYSQTTGKVLASEKPFFRPVGGVTFSAPPSSAESILVAAGVPGNQFHLPRLRDVGLTQQLSQIHAASLEKMRSSFLTDRNPAWTRLQNPEERRTYLTSPMGPLAFAKALTWARMQLYGAKRIRELRQSPGQQDALRRQMALIKRWTGETTPDLTEEPQDPEAPQGGVIPPPPQ